MTDRDAKPQNDACPLCGAYDHERTVVGAITYIACPRVPDEMAINPDVWRDVLRARTTPPPDVSTDAGASSREEE